MQATQLWERIEQLEQRLARLEHGALIPSEEDWAWAKARLEEMEKNLAARPSPLQQAIWDPYGRDREKAGR